MEAPNNDRLLITFVCFFAAFFLSLLVTLSVLNMAGSISFLVYFVCCLFLFSVGLMVYTHVYGKKFINETLDQMTDLFSSGVSHIESVGMLTATPLVTPYGHLKLTEWTHQPLTLRNTGVGVALNVSVVITDGEHCLASHGTSVVAAGDKEKVTIIPARLPACVPDRVDGLTILAQTSGEARLLVFYQDALGIPYLALYGVQAQSWTFLGTVRKTTFSPGEMLAA